MSFKIGNQTYFSSTTRYTSPSLHLTKGTSNTYIPLLKGSKGAVVQFGDYNYTLGGLKVGDYRGAISRVLANNAPTVTVEKNGSWVRDPSTGNATVSGMQLRLNDPDGDVMSLKVYYGVINVASGSGASMNYTQISSLTTSNRSNGLYALPNFSIPFAGGYNNINFALKFDVSDSKGATGSENLYIRTDVPYPPEIQLTYARKNVSYSGNAAACSIQILVRDLDTDTLTVKFYKRKLLAGSGHSASKEDTLLETKSVSGCNSWQSVFYSGTFEYSSYENTSGYGYYIEVTDGNITKSIDGWMQ